MISSVKKARISNQIIPVSYPIIYNPEFVVFLNPWVNMQQCAYSWPIILSYLHFKPGHLKLNKDDNVSQQGEQKMAIIQQIYFFHPILMLPCLDIVWLLCTCISMSWKNKLDFCFSDIIVHICTYNVHGLKSQ